jgi:methylenetetrahydrofolate reductase (NADPH)
MSGLSMAALFERTGMPAIMNLTCRDCNSIALQSTLLGAAALGIQGVFCVSGEPIAAGDHPTARGVYELDALRLVALAHRLRTEGTLLSGRPIESLPHYLIGAAGSLLQDTLAAQAERTAAKVSAGADFIQTPALFDLDLLHEFIARLQDFNTLEQARLIAGVAIVTSHERALWVQAQRPETGIPAEFVDRMGSLPAQEQRAFGLAYAAEMLNEIRAIPGVGGVLLYPYATEEADVLAMCELLDMVGHT